MAKVTLVRNIDSLDELCVGIPDCVESFEKVTSVTQNISKNLRKKNL